MRVCVGTATASCPAPVFYWGNGEVSAGDSRAFGNMLNIMAASKPCCAEAWDTNSSNGRGNPSEDSRQG